MATRSDLVEAIIERYRSSGRADKQRIWCWPLLRMWAV
jgi:hypothetical protein